MRTAKSASARFRDQPMTPQESIVYWTEYVARHNGAPHIKTAAQQLSFIQYHMIDVFAFLTVVGLVGSVTFFKVLLCLCKRKKIAKKKKSKSKSKKN